jgi:hypothetical protein
MQVMDLEHEVEKWQMTVEEARLERAFLVALGHYITCTLTKVCVTNPSATTGAANSMTSGYRIQWSVAFII